MTRREVRDCAFKIVFEQLLRNDDVEELFEIADEVDEITVDDQVRGLVLGVVEHAEELDAIIGKYSKSRAVSRISKLNLAILRLALYEAIYEENTPVNAAISEAIKLSQTYTYQEDTSFINGVLGAFSRDAENSKAEEPANA
ncbi:MAG: transcription antitermination factor NusB [Ruminococcus sp.]|jgi:N utilization substance protein B|nr:transcription antitermination factor NusB [Ruminococcus sp.]MBQ7008855.1 transcription antitermination factor NusB [Ruminococcus sp.]MBR4023548.1 transcription antitermination factor NusB [Ruminococcus sp.]